MQYGFVIDQTRCIGCHACTVACKAENDVPVGDFRTSVKYTERGRFPDVRRHFAVLRCNHCTDAPCVTICPVNALEKRDDGIVDVDRDACIGCRACMQACPYDALYLNDDSGSVEKCHFCAHRVEDGLEPACAVVCPVNAIIAGDLHDPGTRVSLLVTNNETAVRRPEQRTGPNVHYIGADPVTLSPGAAARPEAYLWSDRPPHKPEAWPDSVPTEPDAMTVLDSGHRVEWGWHVAAYLVTKGLAAGAAMLAPFAAALGLEGGVGRLLPETMALIFTAITCYLLVDDLARPWRFYRLLTRPNWSSWLVRGGVILGAFGVIELAAFGAGLLDAPAALGVLRWIGAVIGAAVAGYTALLFAQCKGRDLWESRGLGPHLLVQAVLCGSALFLAAAPHGTALRAVVIVAALGHLAFAAVERWGRHATDNARQGAGFLGVVTLGPLRAWRDGLIIGVGVAIGVALLAPAFALIPVLLGLYLYEHAFVRAGQLPPLS